MDIFGFAVNAVLWLAMGIFVLFGVVYVGGALLGALVGGVWGIITTLRGH